ncbi:MAG TPA: S-layer homology domain-containing protein, partial [Thermoanaerobacterales bacterium]|nr:S-layer homology domain-containing protein [Thermoanaerobacterales bacterium]
MNKRLLALIVAVIFIIGSVATGFAATFEDVVDTDFEDEVNRLVALEIISGYPDGTFRPEGLVTRAEFAKITVSATGVGAAAEYAKGATKFTDVEAEHWAAGYINVATDLGIIQGYGDGRFGPEDQVTYAEAITMIVRSLGYEPAAQAKGGYPGGYLAVAAENDITDGITVLANVAANRGDIAVMVDNSLEVDMMVQDGYGDRPTWKVEKGETLLSKLGVDEVEGKVVEIARVKDSKLDDDEIVVELNDGEET